MTKIYSTPDNRYQMTVDNRLQGWGVQVSEWTGADFKIRFEKYVIAESLWEATYGALTSAGMDDGEADYQLAEWGICQPTDEDEFYECVTCGESQDGPNFNPFSRECETCETL